MQEEERAEGKKCHCTNLTLFFPLEMIDSKMINKDLVICDSCVSPQHVDFSDNDKRISQCSMKLILQKLLEQYYRNSIGLKTFI